LLFDRNSTRSCPSRSTPLCIAGQKAAAAAAAVGERRHRSYKCAGTVVCLMMLAAAVLQVCPADNQMPC
jgi:hypothetical protein